MKQKEYIKISFNTTPQIAEELERLKDTSESFGLTQTYIINEALRKYLDEYRNGKKGVLEQAVEVLNSISKSIEK